MRIANPKGMAERRSDGPAHDGFFSRDCDENPADVIRAVILESSHTLSDTRFPSGHQNTSQPSARQIEPQKALYAVV